MKKRMIALAAALLLLAATLSGCTGAGNNESSVNSGGAESTASTASVQASDASSTPEVSDPAATGTLNLFTWEGMFPQDVLDGFTQETGIEINYSNFDYDENMLTKLEAANGGTYDLIIADDYIIETAIAQELVQKLDTGKLENYGFINPVYQGQFYDPNDEYTVPYGAGIQTIVYNPQAVDMEVTKYADLFDASLKDSVGVTGNFRVINGIGLKINGESYNTEDIAAIDAAGAKMLEFAPNIRLISDDNLQDAIISGEISAGIMYTSQATQAMMADPKLKMVFPEEGIGFGVMAQFIPAQAPNAEAAYVFMDYILRPEISAKCFENLGYYCTNKEAESLISEDMKSLLTLPAEVDLTKMEMIGNISGEASAEHEKIWTEFKAACGQ